MEKLIFKQERIGKGGKPFTVYKLQTMYPHEGIRVDEDGRKKDGDALNIPTREWLRKVGADEFPQLVNMILGQMNFFGVRPITPEQHAQLKPLVKERYNASKPGLIGAYLFLGESRYSHQNPRKANDAYLRLRNKKRYKKWELIQMNMEALRLSLLHIIDGKHT